MVFFRNRVEVTTEEYEIINDYKQAKENAFIRIYEYGESDGQTWVDILEENMSSVWEVIYQCNNYLELSDIVDDIEIPELDDIEYTFDDYDVQEEIYNEIELCVKSRFICGTRNVFFEKLFKVYKFGGWPCGWNNGKIIVYVPKQ